VWVNPSASDRAGGYVRAGVRVDIEGFPITSAPVSAATRRRFFQIALRFGIGATLAVIVVATIFSSSAWAQGSYGAPSADFASHLDDLVRAYPDWISGHDDKSLVLKDGQQFPISDGKMNKTFNELLESPDIDDMFYASYPAGRTPQQPQKNIDPGRVRYDPLFTAMYGDCRKNQVTKNLRKIAWLPKHGGGHVSITTINGVDKSLQAVSDDLDRLPRSLIKYVKPIAGIYSCRTIEGSRARSMHAYAAAIDINTRYSNYWRWAAKGSDRIKWMNQIPVEIIRIFENHGFVWGGNWYHYDTMHFEYRPELLPPQSRR
jgi:hypothetical protein